MKRRIFLTAALALPAGCRRQDPSSAQTSVSGTPAPAPPSSPSAPLLMKPDPALWPDHIPRDLQRDMLHIWRHDDHFLDLYSITDARCNLQKAGPDWEFTIGARTTALLRRIPDPDAEPVEDDFPTTEPHFEATALLQGENIELKAGRVIEQKSGHSATGTNLTNYYYFNHTSLQNVRIELLEVTAATITARFTAIAEFKDQLALLAIFQRDPTFQRSIS